MYTCTSYAVLLYGTHHMHSTLFNHKSYSVELPTLETCRDGPKDCLVNNAGIFYTNSDSATPQAGAKSFRTHQHFPYATLNVKDKDMHMLYI